MNFKKFTQTYNELYPLSLQEIRLQEKNFAVQQLHSRTKKWRLIALTKGRWIHPKTLQEVWIGAVIANMLYEPSYLSLEWALRYYNLIPEGVYQYTSCTTKKTQTSTLSVGKFSYRSLHPRWYWGYDLHTLGRYPTVRIASPEKTLCDYLYFHHEITSSEDFEEQRINVLVWQDIASNDLLTQYASRYPKSVQKRVQFFLDYLHTTDV